MDGKRDCFEMYKLWQPCEEEQLNCASCQRNLDNEQDEGSSLIDKELEVYVGRQYPYYKRKWELENKRIARWSWNGWAAIFNIGWLGYRKYYVPAALFMLLLVACDAFSYYMGFNVALPIINMVLLRFITHFILFEWGFCKWIVLSICGKTYIPNKSKRNKR